MLFFLASVLEQLDLAHEHLSMRDVHNARFSLLLTDNAVELILHQIAKDKVEDLENSPHHYESCEYKNSLYKATGKHFDEKVRFSKMCGIISAEVAKTVMIMHEFRNDLYHVGIQHETIICSVSIFYFEVACHFIGLYEPPMLWWRGDQKLPERAKKYFHRDFFIPGEQSEFRRGCDILAEKCNHVSAETVTALADHMGEVIEDQSTCIDIIAAGVYEGQQITRDRAVIDTYVWSLALSDEGKAFAEKQGWSGSIFELRVWLAEHYPLQYRRDPIPSWRSRASKIRRQENPHTALLQYYSFMKETANLREAIVDVSSRVSAEIDRRIDSIKWR